MTSDREPGLDRRLVDEHAALVEALTAALDVEAGLAAILSSAVGPASSPDDRDPAVGRPSPPTGDLVASPTAPPASRGVRLPAADDAAARPGAGPAPDGSSPTVGAADVDTPRRWPAGPATVQGRGIHRAADSVLSASGSLVASPCDLRMMDRGGREEPGVVIARLRDLLARCPAGTFDEEASATVLTRVATVSEALVAARDERGALRLIEAAAPHLVSLGSHHPAAFELRRARAGAWSELGHHRRAWSLLRRLSEDERRVFGQEDSRTALLLLWTLVGGGRLREADTGFRALQAREIQRQGANAPDLWHLHCRHAWLLGRQGLARESAGGYDGVIINRSHELGEDHPDALDARHSKGKMLVLAGHGPQAVTLLQVLHDHRALVLGDRHPDTLETLKYLHLARVRAEPGNDRVLDSAIDVLGRILLVQAGRHGAAHPMSRDTATHLGQTRLLRQAARHCERTDLRAVRGGRPVDALGLFRPGSTDKRQIIRSGFTEMVTLNTDEQ